MSQDCAREIELLVKASWRLIAMESFEEDRAVRAVHAAASVSNREVAIWSLAGGLDGAGAGEGGLDEGLQAMATAEAPTLFVVLDAHRVLADPAAVRRLRDLIPTLAKRRQAVLLLGPVVDVPLELERETARVHLPLPTARDLEPLFRKVGEQRKIGAEDPSLWEAAVRAALGLTAGEAVRVFNMACLQTRALNEEAVRLIAREKGQALRRTPALSFHEPHGGLEQVGGLGELKHWLRERRRAFDDEARAFGLPTPRGLLLLGVQGCGKSLSAKAVAREWHFPLLRLDLAAAFGDPTRSPEVIVRTATEVAESLAPVVLWIDEIEKGFAASGQDAAASRVFGSFLTWMAEKRSPVFVAATANDVVNLPPELLRRGRFDDLFFVDLPNDVERLEIFAIHLRKAGRDPNHYAIDELAAASERLSGAEIEQVVSAALYTAFAEGRELSDADLANAITETVPLYETYEERIKELRDWARHRTRSATLDPKMMDLFQTSP
ncbi:MAG TPA: AAA family ATPase [Myxococcota bacterium]|nr:AAA family ATPase [Myxococcota bacterium]